MLSSTQEKHTPNRIFIKETKKLYAGPITLILFITGIIYLASLALSFLFEVDYIFLPLKNILAGLLHTDNNFYFFMVVSTLFATLINFLGFTIIRFHGAAENLGKGCLVGCYFLKITKLLQHIALIFATVFVVVPIIVALNKAYEHATGLNDNMAYWSYICAVLASGIAVIFFHLLNTISVSVMKEAIASKSPISGTHILSAIGYFLLAATTLGLQCYYTYFNLTLVIASIYCILWGVYTLRFRSVMNAIAKAE